jgi:hypothetical protein
VFLSRLDELGWESRPYLRTDVRSARYAGTMREVIADMLPIAGCLPRIYKSCTCHRPADGE